MTLKDWLKVNRISLRQFALSIKSNPSSMSLVVSGKRLPTYSIVRRVYLATQQQVGLMDWPEPT